MIIPLPGGAEIDTGNDTSIVSADDGRITLHTPLALIRLIERWKNQPNLAALLSTYTDQLQLVENVIWDVIIKRFLDFAQDIQLDTLGALVGEARNGLPDPQYRVRINARILVNRSFGTPDEIIAILKLIDTAAFHLVELDTAAFQIYYDAPPSTAAALEIASLVREARPAGVRATVVMPTDLVRGARYDSHAGALGLPGYSSILNPSVGGLYATIQLA